MSVITAHQKDLTTFCKFKRDPSLRRALHLLLNRIYRHPEIATDNWLYLNDLTITTQDM